MKTHNFAVLVFIILIGIVVIPSCTTGDTTNKETETISSDINSKTTWKGDKTYIIEKNNLYINAELTIEDGAIIKLMSGVDIILNRDGNIIANGTSAKPIVFTSIKEVKFKPTDGLGKLIEKSKAITVKLQHSNTASSFTEDATFLIRQPLTYRRKPKLFSTTAHSLTIRAVCSTTSTLEHLTPQTPAHKQK